MDTPIASKDAHILIVDDNQDIIDTLILILERQGYRVTARTVLVDFCEGVSEISPDVILLDKSLGWADGCDLCRLIKNEIALREIPVIMFSAYYKKKEECLAAGADDFVEKPFAIADLLTVIKATLLKKCTL